jgi:predicted Zn finger-like uncharacterized protein
MIVVCPSCQARYKFDETKLGSRPKAKTRCAKCGGTIEIENPLMSSVTLPPDPVPEPEPAAPPAAPEIEPAPPSPAAAAAAQERTKPTPRPPDEPEAGSTITGRDLHRLGLLELPKDKRFSLAVIQGAATGQIHQITRTRTTLGRSGADINLDDPEASRQHAVVEIYGDQAILRDLGSTNGTFVDMERIEQLTLSNHMEFRIGSHVLMFIITEVE